MLGMICNGEVFQVEGQMIRLEHPRKSNSQAAVHSAKKIYLKQCREILTVN